MFIRYSVVVFAAITVCLFHNASFSQIPNGGFESWAGVDPTNWATTNAPPVLTNVIQSTVSHGGALAVRGDVITLGPVGYAPAIQSGPGGHGFAYNQRPASFAGYYQFHSVGGDKFGINVELFAGGETGTLVAIAATANPTEVTAFTSFNVPFAYQTSDIPDLCIVQILIAGPVTGSDVHPGSYFILDDIELSGSADVKQPRENLPLTTSLSQNYPNPFNPSTTISYQLSGASLVTLNIYDMLGREVTTLVHGMSEPGVHSATWDASNHPSGVYYCRLAAGSVTQTKTLVLTK